MLSYAALGLVSSLQINPSGGLDPTDPYHKRTSPSSSKTTLNDDADEESDADEQKQPVRYGMGRIVRDAEGNVVDIIEADGDAAPKPHTEGTPWGPPLNASDEEEHRAAGEASRTSRARALHLPVKADGDDAEHPLHKQLDSLAEELSAPVPRFTSHQEDDWLRSIVQKYGEDFARASRDRAVNPWQRTEGQIRRA